jgi:hypothetical protein
VCYPPPPAHTYAQAHTPPHPTHPTDIPPHTPHLLDCWHSGSRLRLIFSLTARPAHSHADIHTSSLCTHMITHIRSPRTVFTTILLITLTHLTSTHIHHINSVSHQSTACGSTRIASSGSSHPRPKTTQGVWSRAQKTKTSSQIQVHRGTRFDPTRKQVLCT